MPQLRIANVQRLGEVDFDVLVVGGGINGAVSAACLSARGAKVALIDKGDFAGFTSQQSSNLAWGGIKYMETMEFGLVRKLCMSRNHLIRSYPSTVQEIRFFAAHPRGFRHGLWKLYLGAWIYWFIGSLFTKKPRLLPQSKMAREEPVIDLEVADGGFEYSDAFLHDNDARFVFNFVRGALNYGCVAANYVESRGSEYDAASGMWVTRAKDISGSRTDGREITIRSRVVVNACGPYVDSMNGNAGEKTSHHHVFSKGIHLIVDRITPHRRVLTMFADDGRPFFVIPMGPRSCIGTTDTRVDRPETHVTAEDRRFVLDNINKRLKLKKPLTEADIIAERCGVRPLAVTSTGNGGTDWTQLSRKHAIEVDRERRHISIFGGKLTDCLNVGEEIAEEVQSLGVSFPYPQARWYGEPPDETHREFLHQARLMNLDGMTPPSSSEKLTSRLWRRYGAEALGLLEDIRADPRMAELVVEGAEYLRCEIAQAARREMIVKLDDFLRRRSKIALVIHKDVLRDAPGLREACEILFGADADRRFEEYFATADAPGTRYPVSA
ncbi:FAD-dependent oxidoreductase [Pendulispora rubella]|uniref:FAD-dependent oxidoreductase n=1 Tax=Pendulispora rubella TaxID=2741070 RepID=A0ABZ2LGP8_9BACT